MASQQKEGVPKKEAASQEKDLPRKAAASQRKAVERLRKPAGSLVRKPVARPKSAERPKPRSPRRNLGMVVRKKAVQTIGREAKERGVRAKLLPNQRPTKSRGRRPKCPWPRMARVLAV